MKNGYDGAGIPIHRSGPLPRSPTPAPVPRFTTPAGFP